MLHEPSTSTTTSRVRGSSAWRVAIVAGLVSSCAAARPAPATAPAPQGETSLAMARQSRTGHTAHALLVEAASCWFGGLWGDVQGESPEERRASSAKHCESIVRDVFGKEDPARYEQVRAFETETIDDVAAKVAMLASADPVDAPRKDALVKLLHGLADAQKETMLARRAGHRILRDLEREPEKLSNEEVAALPELEASRAFVALDRLDAGSLQKEAHAFTLLVALDRMNIAQEIPLHLKPYPVVEPYRAIFGVAIPDLPHDASKPLPRAGWLTYLTRVAAAAGHPVTQPALPPQIRHEHAVKGILAGISDRLKVDAEGVAPETSFARIVQLVIRDLDAVATDAGGAKP
jgi:hypothetical protein